ncbi:MAG: hypothetical protein LJE70_09890 [Chromatiaceae bacterium]|jgi:hypothetical protein|nr:hypothetical protein [Chromatiaceae bacterium]
MLKVKYPRITNEWTSLKKKNPSLAQVVWDLQVFVKDSFKKDVIITHLFRTQKQQELFYGKGTKRKSPHQYWGAVDIRDSIYTSDEIAYLKEFLKAYDNYNNYRLMKASMSRTVLRHNIGHGMHFHIQFYNKKGQIPPRQIFFTEGTTIVA